MHRTYSTKASDIKREWWIVDAEGQPIGRLAAIVAHILQGKHKVLYAPHLDMGDHVIILNAEKAVFTGNKGAERLYWHSMHPGGLKSTTRGARMAEQPEKMLMHVISGMLPKNKLRARRLRRVRIYRGSEHPHTAQQPKTLESKK